MKKTKTKPKTKPKLDLSEFLMSEEAVIRSPYHTCRTCQNPDLKANIDEFWAMRDAGTTKVSFQRYCEKFVFKTFGDIVGFDALRKHVIRCLRRDIPTGKSLR